MSRLLLSSIAALFLATGTAHAQTNGTLTLACRGAVETSVPTNTGGETTKETVSIGIVVNFATKTVEGFRNTEDPVKIIAVTPTTIEFAVGENRLGLNGGTIDRVTGETSANFLYKLFGSKDVASSSYSLKCKPAQRMF